MKKRLVNSGKKKRFICLQTKQEKVPFNISKFTSSSKDLSPYSRIRATTDSLLLNIVLSVLLISLRTDRHESMKEGPEEKIMRCSFYVETTATKGI